MNAKRKSLLYALLLIVTLVLNAMGAFGVFNGLSQKEISDMYLTLITPSPTTFSIWSLIYGLIIASVIMMIVDSGDSYYKGVIEMLTILFPLTFIFNAAWIISFSFLLIELSVVFISALMLTLVIICRKLFKVHEAKRWLIPLTFGLYTGWLLIATVVNISATLVKLEWNGFGIPIEYLAIGTLVVATVIVIITQTMTRNAALSLPVAWALWGINRFLISPEGFSGAYNILEIVTLVLMVILLGSAIFRFVKNKYSLL